MENRAPESIRRKAVFLDRDGTIIVDANYLSDPADVVLLPGAERALAMLKEADFLLFLFTNQSGVGRGYFSIEAVHRCNERMVDLLGLGRTVFTSVGIAPEHPDQPSRYRKPSPHFINECVDRYGLDRQSTWMVGDKISDAQAGINAGVRSALVGGDAGLTPGEGVKRFESLLEFAQSITDRNP